MQIARWSLVSGWAEAQVLFVGDCVQEAILVQVCPPVRLSRCVTCVFTLTRLLLTHKGLQNCSSQASLLIQQPVVYRSGWACPESWGVLICKPSRAGRGDRVAGTSWLCRCVFPDLQHQPPSTLAPSPCVKRDGGHFNPRPIPSAPDDSFVSR